MRIGPGFKGLSFDPSYRKLSKKARTSHPYYSRLDFLLNSYVVKGHGGNAPMPTIETKNIKHT